MKKKRFSSYLMTGKVASMPFINSGFADVVPSYTDVLSANASIIEMPATGVRLYKVSEDVNTYGGYDAALCSTAIPTTMNIVVTGAKPGNIVYLVASSNKDDGTFQALSPKIRIGSENFTIVSSFSLGNITHGEEAGSFAESISPTSIPVDISKLQQKNLFNNGKFYLQAVILSTWDEASMWQTARFSELDEVVVTMAGCPSNSTYGGSAYGGSPY
ncbi:MAG: hypothetical protein Q7U38_09645 [Methylobacter sp.]|nr:hypothetical protein [Methylobacter sp.]MDP2099751.1 hypothetical protein [Methylobacter sp.]MDP2430385.1 hypothetical protein [Methylobacter sp.]MDP3053553.1 hypothetical protein [Methylobacter sp.]MDP3362732.1 hypothetical protein [Methylobacter sp.]